jgi:hypothetical protein
MDRRRLLSLLALVAGGAFVGAALFWPKSDEELINEQLDYLVARVSFEQPMVNPMFFGTRLAGDFKDIFAEQVFVEAPEARQTGALSPRDLALLTAKALARFSSLDASWSDKEIQVMDESATVKAKVRVVTNRGLQPQVGTRTTEMTLERLSGGWKISRIRISPEL